MKTSVVRSLSPSHPTHPGCTAYLRLVVDVPGEGNGVIRDLLDVADGVEAFFVVGYEGQTEKAAVTSPPNGI